MDFFEEISKKVDEWNIVSDDAKKIILEAEKETEQTYNYMKNSLIEKLKEDKIGNYDFWSENTFYLYFLNEYTQANCEFLKENGIRRLGVFTFSLPKLIEMFENDKKVFEASNRGELNLSYTELKVGHLIFSIKMNRKDEEKVVKKEAMDESVKKDDVSRKRRLFDRFKR